MALHVSRQATPSLWQYAVLLHSLMFITAHFSTHAGGLPCKRQSSAAAHSARGIAAQSSTHLSPCKWQ
jgi:hypothetical protein